MKKLANLLGVAAMVLMLSVTLACAKKEENSKPKPPADKKEKPGFEKPDKTKQPGL